MSNTMKAVISAAAGLLVSGAIIGLHTLYGMLGDAIVQASGSADWGAVVALLLFIVGHAAITLPVVIGIISVVVAVATALTQYS